MLLGTMGCFECDYLQVVVGLSETRQMAVFGRHAMSCTCNLICSAANVFNMDFIFVL